MPRLDIYLYQSGIARSRSVASRLIKSGGVTVNGKTVTKCGFEVEEGAQIALSDDSESRFVSRGGLKLEAALEAFSVSPEGLVCADIGASTGGFTQCLLLFGAKKVYAVDSGSGQLHPALARDARVISMENQNARFLDESVIPCVDLCVMDVSFISQRLLYPAVRKILRDGGTFISLIKPQFEVGRESIGSGGIVRDEKAREKAVEELRLAGEKYGLIMKKWIPSPIEGGDGNREFLALWSTVQKEKKEREE